MKQQKHPKILTKGFDGKENGYLIPIYNENEGFIDSINAPKQIYLTVCEIGAIKGPHLHLKRWGYFTCIKGNVKIIVKIEDHYEKYYSGEDFEFATIEIPAGIPAAIQNISNELAFVLNTPSPAWKIDCQDDHYIEFDQTVFYEEK